MYRVLRIHKGDKATAILIGHYDLKSQARMAAHDDQLKHDSYDDLVYEIEWVDSVMTQEEIDKIFKELK